MIQISWDGSLGRSRQPRPRKRRRSGIDRSHYGGMERGERNPSLTSIIKIANALSVEPSEIHIRAEQIQATKARH